MVIISILAIELGVSLQYIHGLAAYLGVTYPNTSVRNMRVLRVLEEVNNYDINRRETISYQDAMP